MIVLTVQLCCSQTGPFVNLIHFIILLYFIHINVLLTTLLQEMKVQTSSIANWQNGPNTGSCQALKSGFFHLEPLRMQCMYWGDFFLL